MARRATKRPNGAGERARFNQPRQRWEARVTVGHDPVTGAQRRRLVTGATAKACQLAADTIARSVDDTGLPPDDRMTVADYARHWLDNAVPNEGLAPTTVFNYEENLKLYILPVVGKRRLRGKDALSVADVERIIAGMRKRGYQRRTILGARTTLVKMLARAERSGLVDRNVARLVKGPRDEGRERTVKALTADEIPKLLAALDDTRYRAMALLQVATGMRPGELFGLTWADIDLDRGLVTIRRSWSRHDGALKDTKTARSRRSVPFPTDVGIVEALKAWRAVQGRERLAAGSGWLDTHGLAFTSDTGHAVWAEAYRYALLCACDRAGIERHPPYHLRHTFATQLIENGAPPHEVAELMGDTLTTVMSHYSFSLRQKDHTAIMSAVLRSTS